ncbi:ArnT family glycosyltransferase [Flaviflagellibacter deserti]|jgi:4-amino-4-deoxy-L-arabinose transferase-like glycosyltransferase|uniref:ArnT family glycosyltransferase n=1 Tax=Flaviflagellibacter deserti TaxID=2267266 RepID=A0ABV9YZ38_9HYPH
MTLASTERASPIVTRRELSLSPTGLAVGLSFLFVAVALLARPLLPIDETRYLTVAWEMWNSGNYLVPHLNGETYAHKPPLLFWLINLAWAVTGPSEIVARLVPALSMPVAVFLTSRLGRELNATRRGAESALVLASMLVFVALSSMTMFDGLLTVCVLVGLIGLVRAGRGERSGFVLLGVAIGLGVLAKGPVIAVHLLPAALLAPVWAARRASWKGWYLGVVCSIAIGTAIGLVWAIPAAIAGGQEFANELFLKQSAGRVVDAFAHKKPFWFYIAILPLVLCPFTFSRSAIRSLVSWPSESAREWRLLTISAGCGFIIFSLMSGKQVHYLLPLLPAAALLMQRVRNVPDDLRWFVLTLAVCLVMIAVVVSLDVFDLPTLHINADGLLVLVGLAAMLMLARHDLTLAAAFTAIVFLGLHLHGWRSAFIPYDLGWVGTELRSYHDPDVAFVGLYHGEIAFLGRLDRPVAQIGSADISSWRTAHPRGIVIAVTDMYHRDLETQPDLQRPYRGGMMALWRPLQPEQTNAAPPP